MNTPRSCPRCGKKVPPGCKTAPLCSPRCQMADLGAWLGEEYRIPAREEDESEDAPPPPGTDSDDEM